MYVRAKEVKGTTYYQVVHGYRDAMGRVRHQTLASLGRHPTIPDALTATERELRKLRRELHADRALWPDGATRPAWSEARLLTLERRLARAEEQRRRLKALLDGSDGADVDTTEQLPPDTVIEGQVGGDVATLHVHADGMVDVITTVRGETRRDWVVPPAEVPAMLRDRGFMLCYAVWSEPRPRRGSR